MFVHIGGDTPAHNVLNVSPHAYDGSCFRTPSKAGATDLPSGADSRRMRTYVRMEMGSRRGFQQHQFHRAIETRQVPMAWSLAHELRPLSRADSLALLILLADGSSPAPTRRASRRRSAAWSASAWCGFTASASSRRARRSASSSCGPDEEPTLRHGHTDLGSGPPGAGATGVKPATVSPIEIRP